MEQFSRTAMLLGEAALERLRACRVAVFGIGGVGGYAAEALARSGIGALDLIDGDEVTLSNLNRQIIALHSTLHQNKAELMRLRILDINPRADVRAMAVFYTPETASAFDLSGYDYILDCVDMVSAKLALAGEASRLGVALISAMGAGNKTDPTRLAVGDISRTSVCPLARVMRRELQKRGIPRLTVVYSTEQPVTPKPAADGIPPASGRRAIPGSLVFVPGAMGLCMAGYVVRELLNDTKA